MYPRRATDRPSAPPPSPQIARLLTIVLFAVHFFACAFWRVAVTYRTPDELDAWLAGKHVEIEVSHPLR